VSSELRRARNRQMIIFLLVCFSMLIMLGRLYYWQIMESTSGYHLAQRADAEHIQNQIVNAPRGLIYDIHGQLLATNVVRDDVYIMPIQFSVDHPDTDTYQNDLKALIYTLHQVLPSVSEDDLKNDFSSGTYAVRIAQAIDPSQSEQLRKLRLPDVFLEPRTLRSYPGGDLAAQILGYVQDDSNGQDSQGVYGIEQQYNTLLVGKPGSFTAETDLNGNPLTVGASSKQPAVNGANLTLTIDSSIQYFVQTGLEQAVKTMGAPSGTAVVINARTGAVLAMAGAPSFDPNNYGAYASTNGCLGQQLVYFNPALYCTYEPGSTMKAVTMAAALDQGLVTPDTTINDPGYMTFNNQAPTVTNWDNLAYGQETMTQVLEHSANVGAAWLAYYKLGASRYYPYLARFGFGQATGIDGAENPGWYRTPQSPGWSPSDLTRQAFGQSIEATPLQVAMAYQAIANGGVLMKPYLVASINNNGRVTTTRPQIQRRVISANADRLLTGMLVQSAAKGLDIITVPGYNIAAKTGTATTQGIAATETEASVAGFFPATNPRFVILVKLDRPQATIYGGTAAAPLWKAIAQRLIWYYSVPPDQQ
jgi:cell division protein FtsI/penicillin-binding protein 2